MNQHTSQLNQAVLRENQSLERESFYQEQIEAMQRLLEAPKPNMTTFTDQKPEPDIAPSINPKVDIAVPEEKITPTPEPTENPRIPVPEHIEPEPKKRGFLSRFFLPNG